MFISCGCFLKENTCVGVSLVERRSKVQEKNMSCDGALNFDQ